MPRSTARALLALLACTPSAGAQANAWASPEGNVVVPQVHSFVIDPDARRLHVAAVDVDVALAGAVATTSLDISIKNPGDRTEEGSLLVPVPEGAVVRGFDFQGAAAEPTARLLPADEARTTYLSIVSRSKDPALLEFCGYATLRSSVFPVPPRGEQKVRLVYEHVLASEGGRFDYVLPRSDSLSGAWVPWTIDVRLASDQPISTVYSPTHAIETQRPSPREARIALAGGKTTEPGTFRLSYLLEGEGLAASIFAYADARAGGGYFLLLGGLPLELPDAAKQRRRELIFVLDRSGSMAGAKFDQARAAVLQVLNGLEDGEAFNVVDYSSGVERFAPGPVVKSKETLAAARAYVGKLQANGGTALEGALREALAEPHDPELLPLVLFLTDGLPTVGVKDEAAIRASALQYNAHGRRLFTFGVGDDVNAPLLDRLAEASRATSELVAPDEDVEEAVSKVFARLRGPVLSAPTISVLDEHGAPAEGRVRELLPSALPDLYEGDQLVLLGQYAGTEPVTLLLRGDWCGVQREFAIRFNFERAAPANAFVPRLWASRRIAELVDEVRQGGAEDQAVASLLADPKQAEVMQEILRLSLEYGVLTEYTSFLALEGTDLGAPEELLASLDSNLRTRARAVRVGKDARVQSRNISALRVRSQLSKLKAEGEAGEGPAGAQRVVRAGDRSFYRRGDLWVDARLVRQQKDLAPRSVAFGSPEHVALVQQLVDGRSQGVFALRGRILLEVEGEAVLLQAPPKTAKQVKASPAAKAEPEQA